ncbi:MAG: MlaD family protein [Candidatus Moduliflexus flocculans]|nr:MlaD family protein [Candidatus Moduliflexus flocculans]
MRIGALVLVGIILFIGLGALHRKTGAPFSRRSTRSGSPSGPTEGLAVGSPVRLAGVTVGNVTRIAFGRQPR